MIFMDLIDIGPLASYVAYTTNFKNWTAGKCDKRNTYLEEVAEELMKNLIQRRYETTTKQSVKRSIASIRNMGKGSSPSESPKKKQKERMSFV